MENEDLNVKIGSKEESEWSQIEKAAREDIERAKRSIIINEAIVEVALEKQREFAK